MIVTEISKNMYFSLNIKKKSKIAVIVKAIPIKPSHQ